MVAEMVCVVPPRLMSSFTTRPTGVSRTSRDKTARCLSTRWPLYSSHGVAGLQPGLGGGAVLGDPCQFTPRTSESLRALGALGADLSHIDTQVATATGKCE
jgi:hypothetical protein